MLLALMSLLILNSCSSDDSRASDPITNDDVGTVDDPPDDTPRIIGFIACESGQAGLYPCSGMNLMSQIPLALFDATQGNDSWGWKDPDTGKEYALMGLNNGTAFVDISSPSNPIYLGKLPTATTASPWRDIKVYNNHAFIVAEAEGHSASPARLFNQANLQPGDCPKSLSRGS